jgi:hypothetical protein
MNETETTEDRNIAGWKHEASPQAILAVAQAESAAAKVLQFTGEAMTEGVDHRSEISNRAFERFEDAGRKLANGNVEKMHTLLSFTSTAQGNLLDLRESLAGLVEGVVRTNLRLAQEIFLIESPRAFAELQERFLREYIDAFQQGAAALLRATSLPEKPSPGSP